MSQLDNLNAQEKEIALKILNEMKLKGSSKTYTDLVKQDYAELPVDIITFVKDNRYLGKAWHTADGKCKLFPFWEEQLKKLFPDPYSLSVNNLIESGARGLGKSEIAVTCGLYMMHRLMCLKNPHEYYQLKPTEKFAFAFMNITEALAMDIGISKFQATVQLSPWFMERGTITGRDQLIWNPPSYINIIIGSQARHVIGQPIFFCFFDEISFIRNQDIEKQKSIAIDMIDTAIGGMKTRFLRNGSNPTLLILASSKRSEKSFLEEHTKRKLRSEKENALIIDEPVWHVRPKNEYSGKTFKVAQGNRFLASEIIPDNKDTKEYVDKGYKILTVPFEYYSEFADNIDRAMCDFAGVSSSDITKYISGARLIEIKSNKIKNLFTKDIIIVGNAKDDLAQYYDYIDLSRLDRSMLSKPMFIHLDMSISGDKTGIAGIWIKGKKPHQEGVPDSKELYYQVAFSVSVQAPKGYQISFEKNRQLIYWLREQGFSIKGISSDTYQNADLAQQLANQHFNYEVISVDKVNPQSHECEPYQYFKSSIYEERILLYDEGSELLTTEILGLEKNSNGKIDHPDGGRSGCFTGDTQIQLVDGRTLTLLELVDEFKQGKQNYVYSFNEVSKRVEPKVIENAWCTQHDAELLEITLDNGQCIRCTPNHKFMLRDGQYCEAQNLKANDSLMPLYTRVSNKGVLNYKIASVKPLPYTEDVYDLTIKDNHNFALAAGIFVHNSKDQSDAVCGAIWNASRHGAEYAFDYGESIELMLDTSTDTEYQQRQQITMNFEQALKEAGRNIPGFQIDFGAGKAQDTSMDLYYASQGILTI